MPKRPFLLFALLLGGFALFRLRPPKPGLQAELGRQTRDAPDFRDFVEDAFLLCDGAGEVLDANAQAETLFGAGRLPPLCYPTGQAVPPGQHPLHRAARSRETVSGLYRMTPGGGTQRILDITARPLPDGRAVAVFRDVTDRHGREEREKAAQARQAVMERLRRRLSSARTADEAGRAVAEEVYALLGDLPDVRVRLFVFDRAADTLTCLASAPEDRPRRPRSLTEARPGAVRFDAQVPELWRLYVAREPTSGSLPLIAGGVALGHLSVDSPGGDVFGDPVVRDTLELSASLAALALAGSSASALAAADAAQAAALREIAAAAGSGGTQDELADLVCGWVRRVTQAEVCTLSVPAGGKLCMTGKAYQDDLLFPDTAPDDPRLHGKAAWKAWRTQKIAAQPGAAQPGAAQPGAAQREGAGPWRAFTDGAGYSVTALPLPGRRGVLAVYAAGDRPLPDAQTRFLQTLAALLALSPALAIAPEAPAG